MNKQDMLLQPPIEYIEASLFAPPVDLIQRWIRGDVSDDESKQLKDHPISLQYRKSFENTDDSNDIQATTINTNNRMPAYLENLLDRHIQAKKHFQSETNFKAGQVRLLKSLPNKLHNKPDKKLAVFLLEKISSSNNLWRGFMTASETSWAGWWDMLLEDNVDGPFDPIAGMIQIWNPVILNINNLGSVLAELSNERIKSVKSLQDEYLFGNETDINLVSPGKVFGRETSNGDNILTGSPLAENDSRHRYQQLYHHVAKVISVPLIVEAEEKVTSSLLERFFDSLQDLAEQFGNSLIPQPTVAYAMGADSSSSMSKTMVYNDRLELNVTILDDLIRIQARMIEEGECYLSIAKNDDILQEQKVDSENNSLLEIDPDENCTLLIKCSNCSTIRFNFPL